MAVAERRTESRRVVLQDFEFAGGRTRASRDGANGAGTEAEPDGEQMQLEDATDGSEPRPDPGGNDRGFTGK